MEIFPTYCIHYGIKTACLVDIGIIKNDSSNLLPCMCQEMGTVALLKLYERPPIKKTYHIAKSRTILDIKSYI